MTLFYCWYSASYYTLIVHCAYIVNESVCIFKLNTCENKNTSERALVNCVLSLEWNDSQLLVTPTDDVENFARIFGLKSDVSSMWRSHVWSPNFFQPLSIRYDWRKIFNKTFAFYGFNKDRPNIHFNYRTIVWTLTVGIFVGIQSIDL